MCLSFLGLRLSNIRPGPKPNDLPFLDNHILQPIYLPFICQNPNILPGGQSIHICRTVAFVPDFQSFFGHPFTANDYSALYQSDFQLLFDLYFPEKSRVA